MDSSPTVAPPYVAGPLRMEPFRGLMLAARRVGDPASARAFARPYRDVADRLADWEARGFLRRDPEPALYLHEYSTAGLTIRGLVGALDLSRRAHHPDERVVLPHEGVHPAQAAELADRMTEMQLNPAPILLVHRGPVAGRRLLREVAAQEPDHAFTDRSGQRNRVWALRSPELLSALAPTLARSRVLIADGHHRYAAYLRMQEAAPGGPADRGLAMLVDQDDTPLFLGAIHRLLVGTSFDQVATAAGELGGFRLHGSSDAVAALGPRTLVVTDGDRWASLTLADAARAPVQVLHEALLPTLHQPVTRVGYHHSVDDTLEHVRAGQDTAVLMPAPDFDVVRRIVARDRLLPEKATSFQPKPSLGVLMRSLRDG